MTGIARADAPSPKWPIILIGIVCLLLLAYLANAWFNNPVGRHERITGTLSGNCVPRGKQSNSYHCTATLTDGSTQTFIAQRSLTSGTRVDFHRRERRYFGNHYELAQVAP
jgi:hypothetical protein